MVDIKQDLILEQVVYHIPLEEQYEIRAKNCNFFLAKYKDGTIMLRGMHKYWDKFSEEVEGKDDDNLDNKLRELIDKIYYKKRELLPTFYKNRQKAIIQRLQAQMLPRQNFIIKNEKIFFE